MRNTRRSKTSFNEKRSWNSGRLVGQKPPLKRKDIWAVHDWLQLDGRKRDLALFNLAIDTKLRGCDLVAIKITDAPIRLPFFAYTIDPFWPISQSSGDRVNALNLDGELF